MYIKKIGKNGLFLLIAFYLNFSQADEQAMDAVFQPLISIEKIIEQANQAFDTQHFEQAMMLYDQVITAQPDNQQIIYWASLSANAINEYEKEINYLLRLKQLDNNKLKPRELLVQAYQNIGEFTKRDHEHQQIIQLWNDKKIVENFYIRDKFKAGDYYVRVVEYFNLNGNFPRKYLFIPQKERDKFPFVVLLNMNYKNGKGEQIYLLQSLDGKKIYSHKAFEIEPSYDEIRKLAYNIIESDNLIGTSMSAPLKVSIKELIAGRRKSSTFTKSIHYQYAFKTLPKAFFNNPVQFYNLLEKQGGNYLQSLLSELQDSKEKKQKTINPEEVVPFIIATPTRKIAIIKLPKPSKMPEAYYVAPVIDKDGSNKNRYFTFEKTQATKNESETETELAVLCEITQKGRINYSIAMPAPNQASFLQLILDVLDEKILPQVKSSETKL